jgi:hypothetical protein
MGPKEIKEIDVLAIVMDEDPDAILELVETADEFIWD